MGKHQQKFIQPLTGQFLGWGDDRIPHRYIKLATTSGEQILKVAKSLRPLIQEWQPGIWLTLLGQKQVNIATGKISIKVKQLLTPPAVDNLHRLPHRLSPAAIEPIVAIGNNRGDRANTPTVPTQIRVCQGSSCRRRGSEGICRAMQTYLDRNHLTQQVEIKSVKCLHQCKAAPHAIVTHPSGGLLPEKTHYRQLQPDQVKAILDRHFPISSPAKPTKTEFDLITKISNYLQQQIGSTFTAI